MTTHTDHPMRHYDRTCPACQDDVKPVAWIYDWDAEGELVRDWISTNYDEAHSPTMGCHNIRPLYTHPAHDDTALLRQALEALGICRIMGADVDGNYTKEITPKVIQTAITALRERLGEKV